MRSVKREMDKSRLMGSRRVPNTRSFLIRSSHCYLGVVRRKVANSASGGRGRSPRSPGKYTHCRDTRSQKSPVGTRILWRWPMMAKSTPPVPTLAASWDLATLTWSTSLPESKASRTYCMFRQAPSQAQLTWMDSFTSGVRASSGLSSRLSKFHTDKTCPNLIKSRLGKGSA